MRSGRSLLLVGAIAASALLVPDARGDLGRTPVWTTTTLAAPGHYYLTRDITAAAPVLTITAPDVVLDLNGHTITATGTAFSGIYVTPPSGSTGVVIIRGGRIRGGGRGVWYSGPSTPVSQVGLRLEDLDLSTSGDNPIAVQSARQLEILRCSVHDSPAFTPAILIEALYQPSVVATIKDSVVTNVGGPGIQIDRLATGVIRDTVVDRWATALDGPGISIEGPGGNLGGVLVEGNTLRGGNANAQGIVVSANAHRTALRKNVITGTMNVGIVIVSNGNLLTRNVIGVTGTIGITIAGHDNTVHGNQVTQSSGNGINVFGGQNNLVDANTVQGNAGYGITFFGSNNAYRGNMLRNNGLGAVAGAATDAGGNIL